MSQGKASVYAERKRKIEVRVGYVPVRLCDVMRGVVRYGKG